jgi:hypothetical protein
MPAVYVRKFVLAQQNESYTVRVLGLLFIVTLVTILMLKRRSTIS